MKWLHWERVPSRPARPQPHNYWLVVLLDLLHFLIGFPVTLLVNSFGEESQQEQKERESYLRISDGSIFWFFNSFKFRSWLFEIPSFVVSLFEARRAPKRSDQFAGNHSINSNTPKSFLDLLWGGYFWDTAKFLHFPGVAPSWIRWI